MMIKLHPWWITGYSDGEGCFMINVFKSKNVRVGFVVKLVYQITAHQTEADIMHSLKAFF